MMMMSICGQLVVMNVLEGSATVVSAAARVGSSSWTRWLQVDGTYKVGKRGKIHDVKGNIFALKASKHQPPRIDIHSEQGRLN